MVGIYKIISPSGRIYIGQSRNINKRFNGYKKLMKSNETQLRLLRSFKKYGVNSHIFEIIEECIVENLNVRERYWQDKFNVLGEQGLNCVLTATDVLPFIQSKETKRKRSGENHFMWNKKHKDETKKRMSESAKLRKASEDTKKKLSEIRKGNKNHFYGKTHNDSSKLIMKEKKIGLNNVRSKIVLCTDTGIFFYSIREAAETFKIKEITLYFQLIGKNKNKTNLLIV